MNKTSSLNCQEQLEALQKEYEEFAYIVSHDLKAPLRAISNLSGWIKEDIGEGIDPEVDTNIRLLQNRVERMEHMINAILQFSRVARTDTAIEEVDVENLVQGIVQNIQQEKQIHLHTKNLPVFTTFASKLRAVFFHLLENSVQFNESDKTEIWLEAIDEGYLYKFVLRDNGQSIPEDAAEKIFNLFYTVQPKDQHDRIGAGLTLTRKIVQFAGGTIQAYVKPKAGLEMMFTWPKAITEDKQ